MTSPIHPRDPLENGLLISGLLLLAVPCVLALGALVCFGWPLLLDLVQTPFR